MSDTPTHFKPGETPHATLENTLEAVMSLHEKTVKSGLHDREGNVKELIKHLEEAAGDANKTERPVFNKLANFAKSLDQHLDHARDHHINDEKHLAKVDEALHDIKEGLSIYKGKTAELVETLETRFKRNGIPVIGELIRPADLPIQEEFGMQVKEHIGKSGLFGKGLSIIGGTVATGVIGHGGLNIKRGLFGYQDPETGEQKSGAFGTLIVGAAEMAAGLLSLNKALTGRWVPGRARHAAQHDHDHHHDHGHHHH